MKSKAKRKKALQAGKERPGSRTDLPVQASKDHQDAKAKDSSGPVTEVNESSAPVNHNDRLPQPESNPPTKRVRMTETSDTDSSNHPSKRLRIEKPLQHFRSKHQSEISEATITQDDPPPNKEPSPAGTSRPLPVEAAQLSHKYDFTMMSIPSSAKMVSKVRTISLQIRNATPSTNKKHEVVVLYAHATGANKLISVVEIVKRDIEKAQGIWWQYSKLEAHVEKLKPRARGKMRKGSLEEHPTQQAGRENSLPLGATAYRDRSGLAAEVDDNEDDEAFERMPTSTQKEAPIEQTKLRNVPYLTIYLATCEIPELKRLFG